MRFDAPPAGKMVGYAGGGARGCGRRRRETRPQRGAPEQPIVNRRNGVPPLTVLVALVACALPGVGATACTPDGNGDLTVAANLACTFGQNATLTLRNGFIAGNVTWSMRLNLTFTGNLTTTGYWNGRGAGYGHADGPGGCGAARKNAPIEGGAHAGCAHVDCLDYGVYSPMVKYGYGTVLQPSEPGSGGCDVEDETATAYSLGGAGGAALWLV